MSKQWLEEMQNEIRAIEKELHVIADEYERLGKELVAKNEALARWRVVLQDYKKRQGAIMFLTHQT